MNENYSKYEQDSFPPEEAGQYDVAFVGRARGIFEPPSKRVTPEEIAEHFRKEVLEPAFKEMRDLIEKSKSA